MVSYQFQGHESLAKRGRKKLTFTVGCFRITLPRGVVKFVGKLGTRLRTSQLRSEVRNVIGNLETNFATSFPPKHKTFLYKMMETLPETLEL